MRIHKIVAALLGVAFVFSAFADYSHAHHRSSQSSATRITLYDLGLLQLAAHDFFHIDRETGERHENGKLDLSTLFDHGYDNIAIGGERRNRENIILFSVARQYGERYHRFRGYGFSDYYAQKLTIMQYHMNLRKAYYNTYGELMPSPTDGETTDTENLAYRTMHDLLPGTISMNGETVTVTDQSLHGQYLRRGDLYQMSAPLDGQFDEEFLDITFVIPPGIEMHVDLLERDSSFAHDFDTDYTFEYFMSELEDGKYDRNDHVMEYIRSLFAKGLNF